MENTGHNGSVKNETRARRLCVSAVGFPALDFHPIDKQSYVETDSWSNSEAGGTDLLAVAGGGVGADELPVHGEHLLLDQRARLAAPLDPPHVVGGRRGACLG